MSVHKLSDCSQVILQQNPFAQIKNEIIMEIKDNDAFRAYCYLQSKTGEWKVIKKDVQKKCGFGERKSGKIFSYLNRCGLIQYINIKDEKGQFVRVDVGVLNGLDFNPDEPFISNNQSLRKLPTKTKPTTAKIAPAESSTCGNAGLLNKEVTKRKIDTKKAFVQKNKKTVDNSKKHDFADSMNMMANERKHIEEHEKRKKLECAVKRFSDEPIKREQYARNAVEARKIKDALGVYPIIDKDRSFNL